METGQSKKTAAMDNLGKTSLEQQYDAIFNDLDTYDTPAPELDIAYSVKEIGPLRIEQSSLAPIKPKRIAFKKRSSYRTGVGFGFGSLVVNETGIHRCDMFGKTVETKSWSPGPFKPAEGACEKRTSKGSKGGDDDKRCETCHCSMAPQSSCRCEEACDDCVCGACGSRKEACGEPCC